MLGGIKVGAPANVSLFRRLSRRWRPLAHLKRQRLTPLLSLGSEDEAKRAPAWIGVKRPAPVAVPTMNAKRSGTTWNPWLWVK